MVHGEELSVQPSAVNDDLVQSIRRSLTISELSPEFSQISRTVLYEITTVCQGYLKYCGRLVPKIFTGGQRMQRMASTLILLEQWFSKWSVPPPGGGERNPVGGLQVLRRKSKYPPRFEVLHLVGADIW
jgi:hypothetical protein